MNKSLYVPTRNKGKEMVTAVNDNSFWRNLIEQIEGKKVIPVIGQGLYSVEIDVANGKEVKLLYDYLAHQVSRDCGVQLDPNSSHKFSIACLEYLKGNNEDYFGLSKFIDKTLKGMHLAPPNSLRELARIKNLDFCKR